jgi:hypothetical protein
VGVNTLQRLDKLKLTSSRNLCIIYNKIILIYHSVAQARRGRAKLTSYPDSYLCTVQLKDFSKEYWESIKCVIEALARQ